MGFFSQIAGPVRSVLNQIVADPDLKVTITYRLFQSQGTFNKATGTKESVFNESSIDVVRLSHTQKSQLIGTSDIQFGDEVYIIRGEDTPTGMSLKDEIIDENGATQNIKNIKDIFGLATAVTIEGGRS